MSDDIRPSEITGTLVAVEFSEGDDQDKPAGTYITILVDEPSDQYRWSKGRMAFRYLPPRSEAKGET